LNIAFDLDGVLYEWHEILYNYMVNFMGYDKSIEYLFDHADEYNDVFWENMWGITDLYNKRPIRKDILSMLNRLNREHTIFYITSRGDITKFVTKKWIQDNKLPQPENLIFSNSKKVPVISNRIKILVEDRADSSLQILPYAEVILVKQSYNISLRDKFKHVITDVLEAEKIINEIALC
jgi:uncharacterized HAD superfamily protein